jgi:hypothetical protein
MGNWLRLDEKENAIDFLEKTGCFLETIPDETRWKWVSISLHGALYGFAICALKGSSAELRRVVYDKKGERWVIGIRCAIAWCQDEKRMRQYTISKALTLSPDEESAICLLIDQLRNNFEHFDPKGWSIEISGMPKIVRHVLRVIEFLVLESGNITLDDKQMDRFNAAVGRIKAAL